MEQNPVRISQNVNGAESYLITPLGTVVTADAKGLRQIQRTIGGKLVLRSDRKTRK